MPPRVEGRVDVESCRVVGGGGNVEATKDHGGELTEVEPVFDVPWQGLKRPIGSV